MKSVLKSKKVTLVFIALLIIVIGIISKLTVNSVGEDKKIKEKLELGEKYLTEMKYEEAIVAFEEVISIEPRRMEAYLGLADAYLGLELPEKALESLERGIAVIKEAKLEDNEVLNHSAELFIKEAEILTDLGRAEEALAKLEEGYQITGSNQIMEVILTYRPNVEASLPEGEYEEAKTVELTSTGVHIYYTLDDSEPNKESNLYESPITLTNGENTIKAVAESEYGTLGEISKYSYVLNLPQPVLSEEERELLNDLYHAGETGELANFSYYDRLDVFSELCFKIENSRIYGQPYQCYDGSNLSTDYTGTGLKVLEDKYGSARLIYYGDLVDGVAQGNGILIFDNETLIYNYQGSWSNNLPNGYGNLHYELTNDPDQGQIIDVAGGFADGYYDGIMIREYQYLYSEGGIGRDTVNGEFQNGQCLWQTSVYNGDRPSPDGLHGIFMLTDSIYIN